MNKTMLILLLLALGLQPGCQKEKPAATEEASTAEVPDQEGWHSRVSATRNGRPEAIVEYGHMRRYNSRKKAVFDEGVTVDFYDVNGRKRSRLTAETGDLNEATNDIMAQGHVVVVSDTGVTVYTEKLGFRQATGKIYSDVDVILISDKGDTLYGTGFESDTQLRKWKITKLAGTSHARLDLSGEKFKTRPPFKPDTSAAKVIEAPK
jgi:LPS export ABC transporter protein LptC